MTGKASPGGDSTGPICKTLILKNGKPLTGKDGLLANKLALISKILKTEDTNRQKAMMIRKMKRKRKSLRSPMDLISGVDQTRTTSLITSTLRNGRSMTGRNSTG